MVKFIRKPLGSRCTRCFLGDRRLLEHHHPDPSTKTGIVSALTGKRLLEELKKTILLCIKCHRDETQVQNSAKRKDYLTLSEDQHARSLGDPSPRKLCKGSLCAPLKATLPATLEYFQAHGTGLQPRCRICVGHEKQRARDECLEVAHQAKLAAEACGHCKETITPGNAHHYDFHHVDPRTKIAAVATLANARKLEAVKEEIKKCQVLCAHCHRIETLSQQ